MAQKKKKATPKEENKIDIKQLIVGCIILVFALFMLYMGWQSARDKLTSDTSVISNSDSSSSATSMALVQATVPAVPTSNAAPEPQVAAPEPQNVIVTFTALTEKDLPVKVYYTTDGNAGFNEEQVEGVAGRAGMNRYNIMLPEKKIARVRIDFGDKPGHVQIKDIYLDGSQKADLNDFRHYEMYQVEDIRIDENGLSFFSNRDMVFIIYRPTLN